MHLWVGGKFCVSDIFSKSQLKNINNNNNKRKKKTQVSRLTEHETNYKITVEAVEENNCCESKRLSFI